MSSSSSSNMTFTTFSPAPPSTAVAVRMSILGSASAPVIATAQKPPHASGFITTSTSTPTCRSLPVRHDASTPRARARLARLRADEAAERREDQAALITTPAQWAMLRRAFASVKAEFTDLDGMSWNVPVPAQSRRSHHPSSICASASAPMLEVDDNTVRPSPGRELRPSASTNGWGPVVAVSMARHA